MTYTSYELISAKVINYRIIPKLYKLKRNDGTYDLFMPNSYQAPPLSQLVWGNEVGINCANGPASDDPIALGTYNIEGTHEATFNSYEMSMDNSKHYGSNANCSFTLKLDNSFGLYPYKIYGYNFSNANAGAHMLQVYNGSTWTPLISAPYNSKNWGNGTLADPQLTLLWDTQFTNPRNVIDWKSYTQLNVMFRGRDTTKFTRTRAAILIYFIHRFKHDLNPNLYRLYS